MHRLETSGALWELWHNSWNSPCKYSLNSPAVQVKARTNRPRVWKELIPEPSSYMKIGYHPIRYTNPNISFQLSMGKMCTSGFTSACNISR
jgi:hypothetical protein